MQVIARTLNGIRLNKLNSVKINLEWIEEAIPYVSGESVILPSLPFALSLFIMYASEGGSRGGVG